VTRPHPRFRRRKPLIVVLAAALLVLLAACASKGGSSGGGGSSARGVSSNQIIIAGDGTLTTNGVPVSLAQDTDTGAQARYHLANSQGGINGRMIKYLGTADDGGSATTLVGNMSKQVLQQHAMLLAPYVSEAPFPATFVSQNQVPIFGSVIDYSMCTSAYVYGFGGCIENATYAETTSVAALTETVMKQTTNAQGIINVTPGKSYAVETTAPLAVILPTLKTAAKHIGWTVCNLDASVPAAGATDYSTYASKMMRSCSNGKGPDGILVILSTTSADAQFISTLRALGWKGQAELAGYDPASLKSASISSALAGSVAYADALSLPGTPLAPIFSTIQAQLKAIGKGSTPIDAGVLEGWIQADMAVEGLKATGKNLSVASLQTALKSWTYPGVSGLTPPAPYPLAHQMPIPCWNVLQVNGTAYSQLYGLTCGEVINDKTGAVAKNGFKP
jgi:ABC-type branched-subunit amino acid transport system substrate-binding protein